jgi:hypothetical protein
MDLPGAETRLELARAFLVRHAFDEKIETFELVAGLG